MGRKNYRPSCSVLSRVLLQCTPWREKNARLTFNTIFANSLTATAVRSLFFPWMHSMRHFLYGDISPHQWLSKHRRWGENLCAFELRGVPTGGRNHLRIMPSCEDVKLTPPGFVQGAMAVSDTWYYELKLSCQRWKVLKKQPKGGGDFPCKMTQLGFSGDFFFGSKKWGPLSGLDTMVGWIYYSWTKKHQLLFGRCQVELIFFGICWGKIPRACGLKMLASTNSAGVMWVHSQTVADWRTSMLRLEGDVISGCSWLGFRGNFKPGLLASGTLGWIKGWWNDILRSYFEV